MEIKPLDTSINSTMIKGKPYNVLEYQEYVESRALRETGIIAVKDGEYILPYRGEYQDSSTLPGIYSAGDLDFEVFPNKKDESNYKNIPVITISSTDNIEEILRKENVLSKLAEPWITSSDNITNVKIKETDDPSMKILKESINSKRCDIDKYANRFGDNFPNDKRQLKNDSVTLRIINRFCENLDMEAILTIRDKSDDVINPMQAPLSISLSTGEFLNVDPSMFDRKDDDDGDGSEDFYQG